MNVTWIVARDSADIASVRLRVHGIAALLAERGVTCAVRTPAQVTVPAGADTGHLFVFSKIYSSDAVAIARQLRDRGASCVFDLCDNRFVYGDERLNEMLDIAGAITCPTDALREAIESHGHRGVTVIPDYMEPATPTRASPSVRLRLALRRRALAAGGRTRLVWFGSAGSPGVSTGLDELQKVVDGLNRVAAEHPLHLTVISNSWRRYRRALARADFSRTYLRWHHADFSEHLRASDLAVLPSSDSDFNRTKSENRVLTCIEHGLPAVAGDIPSYRKFSKYITLGDVESGVRGFLRDPDSARRSIEAARQAAAEQFAPARIGERWHTLFDTLVPQR